MPASNRSWPTRARSRGRSDRPRSPSPAIARPEISKPDIAKPTRRLAGPHDRPDRARALYLFKDGWDTLYRIHGTNEPDTIGDAVSSGCIRMMNQDVIDLYNRIAKGSKVVVLPA